MIVTLNIIKDGPANYQVIVLHDSVEVSSHRAVYPSIARAIEGAARSVPDGFARFVEPRYAGISAGTMTVEKAADPAAAEVAAQHIVGILALLEN